MSSDMRSVLDQFLIEKLVLNMHTYHLRTAEFGIYGLAYGIKLLNSQFFQFIILNSRMLTVMLLDAVVPISAVTACI